MDIGSIKRVKLPDTPGVYFFTAGKKILYIGKATSLRDRVRSYFGNDVLHTRGKHIIDMVTLARSVRVTPTPSVLDALILEASLIKKHQPFYNTKEKDDKSWNYVVITNEEYPRVLVVRERNVFGRLPTTNDKLKTVFGPFTQGTNLKEALKIVRKIFPFRDNCAPFSGRPCFNRQIGLCPGVCTGEISKKEYAERIHEITLFFSGKRTQLLSRLERSMRAHAASLEFEQAGECKRMLFALKHIKDVALINEEVRAYSQKTSGRGRKPFRIEAYDVAHISGTYTVGGMTVVEDGRPKKSDYRKFKIRPEAIRHGADATGQASQIGVNDVLHLEQVLRRRFGHKEWTKPDLVVVDGGVAQKRRAEKVLKELDIAVPVVSVVKDDRHKPKAILGSKELALSYERGILIANGEAHRFTVGYHRQLREKLR